MRTFAAIFKNELVFRVGFCLAHSLARVETFWQFFDIFSGCSLIHFAESDFGQKCQTSGLFVRCAAIIGWFWHHIGKVNTLSKHITGNRGFWWSDSKTLGQNASVICGSWTVPKKLPIRKFAYYGSKAMSLRVVLKLKSLINYLTYQSCCWPKPEGFVLFVFIFTFDSVDVVDL